MRSAGQAEDSAESRKRSEPTTEGDSVHSALRLLPPRVLAPRELAEYHVDVANAMQVQHEGAVVEDRARPPSATTEHLACVADTRATANVLLYFCSSDGEKIPVEIAADGTVAQLRAKIMRVSGEPVVEQWEPAPLAQVDEGQGERDRKSTSHTDMGSGMEPTESVMYSWWGKRLDRDVPETQRPSWRQRKRTLLQLFFGGKVLEDGRAIADYGLQDDSVIHPDWASIQRAPSHASALFSIMDPDYWVERHRQTQEFLAALKWENMHDGFGNGWYDRLVWPGPLVLRRRPGEEIS